MTKSGVTKLVKQLAPKLSVKHAKAADNATRAGGQTVRKIQWKASPSTTMQTIFSANGLTVVGSCDSSSNITVDATGPVADNGELRIQGDTATGGPFFKNYAGFNSASIVSPVSADGGHSEGSGQLVYATADGHVLTLDYGFDWGTVGNATYHNTFVGCTLYGKAVYS
ncbi:MAG TPA: hypothetical protein VMU72_06580 [Gaiellaceae bacterium]|nr:hypothetical protein [Gaiellaceae bacterium]